MSDEGTASPAGRVVAIDTRLLELLCCPLTKGRLIWDAERSELRSESARLAYPVRDGIPIMLPSEARRLDEDEIESKTAKPRP